MIAPPTDPPATSLRVGGEVGPYRILRVLSDVGAVRVFDVEHISIGRRAAMKVLSAEHLAKPGALSRMVEGAQALNRIGHANIVETIDIIEVAHPWSALAIVMELLEGRPLSAALLDSERICPERYVPILAQVADALDAAHAAHFVHRNLKPDNIFLAERGRVREYVKLLGFGIAKSVVDEPSAATSTVPYATIEGTFIGTPAYASPEQALGRPVDNRTDIYSFGVILFELVHGHLPFQGASVGEFLYQHLSAPVPRAPRNVVADPVLRTLDALCRRCLSKARADRPTAAEVRDLLNALASGNPDVVTPMPPPEAKPLRRVGVAVALAIAGLVGLGFLALAH